MAPNVSLADAPNWFHLHSIGIVSDGCSRLAIQDHIAADRCEVTSFGFSESQFVSGLQPVVLTRMVPNRDVQRCIVYGDNAAEQTCNCSKFALDTRQSYGSLTESKGASISIDRWSCN